MKLNTKRTILVGLAFLSISAFWQLYDSIIPLILKNTFHISDTISGGIMAIDNVLALFMLPFFGSLSDKVHTKLGRRTPFILCGTAAAVIAMLFLPFADNIGSLALLCGIWCVTLIAMGSHRSPAVSMPDVKRPAPLRSRSECHHQPDGRGWRRDFLILISTLVLETGKPTIFLIVALVMVAAVLLLLWKIKENPLREEREKIDRDLDIAEGTVEETHTANAPMPPEVKRSLILILISVSLASWPCKTTAFSKYADLL